MPENREAVSESAPETPLVITEVANLVAGPEAPPWLTKYLLDFAPGLVVAGVIALQQPTRAEMGDLLKEIEEAALLVARALSNPVTREFLEMPPLGKIEALASYEKVLRNIAERARIARASQVLLGEAKKTKAGRGRALPPEAISPRMSCAAIIGEAWEHFHGLSAFRSQTVVAAADAYWRACNGEYTGLANDSSGGWRPYFENLNEPAVAAFRAGCRRYLVESERRAAILYGIKPAGK